MSALKLKRQAKFSADDLVVGDQITFEEVDEEAFQRGFKATILSIDGVQIQARIDALHDLEMGGQIMRSSDPGNMGDVVTMDATFVKRVRRLEKDEAE